MKIVIFTPKRGGTHFITRSVSSTMKLPWMVMDDYAPDHLVNNDKYVIGCHTPLTENVKKEIKENNVIGFSLYRNPHDHLYSLYNAYKNNLIYDSLPHSMSIDEMICSEYFASQRKKIHLWPKNLVVSFDALTNSNSLLYYEEKEKLQKILNIDKKIKLEKYHKTDSSLSMSFHWTGGKIHHSLDKLTSSQIKLISKIEEIVKKETSSQIDY